MAKFPEITTFDGKILLSFQGITDSTRIEIIAEQQANQDLFNLKVAKKVNHYLRTDLTGEVSDNALQNWTLANADLSLVIENIINGKHESNVHFAAADPKDRVKYPLPLADCPDNVKVVGLSDEKTRVLFVGRSRRIDPKAMLGLEVFPNGEAYYHHLETTFHLRPVIDKRS